MASHRDHGLLMIPLASDALVKNHHVASGEMPLMSDNQVAGFHKGPFQISIHVATDLTQPCMSTAGVHARHQAGITGQMS